MEIPLTSSTNGSVRRATGHASDLPLTPAPAWPSAPPLSTSTGKGLIYRGERIINWCPRCSTALSDLEVDHEEVEGTLYYISYPPGRRRRPHNRGHHPA